MKVFIPVTDDLPDSARGAYLVPYQPGVTVLGQLRLDDSGSRVTPAAIPARPRAERPAALPPRR